MAEKKPTRKAKPKQNKPGIKKVEEPRLLCNAKLSDGSPCPKTVEQRKLVCMWHNPEDEAWGENFAHLEMTPPEQKRDFVLSFIKAHPEHKLALPVWNGQNADLQGADLSNIDIQNADLFRVDLQDADLRATNLRGAFLSYSNLQGANLENADLQEANLMHAALNIANLKNAKMNGANLRHANLHNANLENADLRDAKLLEARMQNSNLQGADLEGADLSGTVLCDAYLNRAKLISAHLEESNLRGTNLGGAILKAAHLYAADLQDAHLVFADLTGANLNSANLQGANLHLTNLKAADLTEAKLQGVDLSIASSIANIYLSGAWLDRTRMRREQLDDAIAEEQDRNYSAAKYVYLALEQNFDDLGDYHGASWAYRKERRMEKLEAWQNTRSALSNRKWREATTAYSKFFRDIIVEWLCDYGENVWRVVSWMTILLFVVGPLLFSSLGGIVWTKELSQQYFAITSLGRFWLWYRVYLLYTIDTMTTASFSGLQPINDAVKLASGFFAIAGIVLAGLLGFVAGNRIRRS